MRHAARDLDETLHAPEGLGKREDGGGLAEALGGVVPACDAEREHAAAEAFAVLPNGDFAVRVRGGAWIVDGYNVRGVFEGAGYGRGVLGGGAGAEVEGLEASVS